MTHAFDIRTQDMPATMRVLLDDYPRDSWDAHPGFKEKTKHWLSAHQMFRRLGELVRSETELYLDKSREPDDFAGRLSYYGNALVANLHGHHNWEDKSYFPELSAADPRFDAGLEILEKDHQELDRVLDTFTETANRSIKLIHLDEPQAREEAGRLHGLAGTIEAFLDRHLADEEELAVPIILHHRLLG
ncbi:MAG: hemerythrin domain-containing protein [Roseibium sp.]|uniref:hemerythrin domain-containing protein n=1 Tax=Roseibium sp. TaxID=1936156 RepID=UPI003D9C5444